MNGFAHACSSRKSNWLMIRLVNAWSGSMISNYQPPSSVFFLPSLYNSSQTRLGPKCWDTKSHYSNRNGPVSL